MNNLEHSFGGSLPGVSGVTTPRRLATHIGVTAVGVGGLIAGSHIVSRFAPGAVPQHFELALLAGLGPVLLFSLFERLVPPAGPRKSLTRWFLHLQIIIFNSYAFLVAGALAGVLSAYLSRYIGVGWIDLRFASGRGVFALIGAFVVFQFVQDFFFYWSHRLWHRVPFLWQLHKFHHMDPELDVLTTARENWIYAFPFTFLITFPMALCFKFDDVDPFHVGLVGGLVIGALGIVAFLNHANIRLQLGKASVLWCGPQVHRIHHSRLPQHWDKNFCGRFPIWDILFGTYYHPARDEFPPTGVDGEQEVQSFTEAVTFTPREWWKMFRAWRNRGR